MILKRQKLSAFQSTKEIDADGLDLTWAASVATRPTCQRMIQDCFDTMNAMNVKVTFLPLGLYENPELHPAIVEGLAGCRTD